MLHCARRLLQRWCLRMLWLEGVCTVHISCVSHIRCAARRAAPAAVVASEKGVVVGRLTFREDGDLIDCKRMGVGGKAIPPNIDKASGVGGRGCGSGVESWVGLGRG